MATPTGDPSALLQLLIGGGTKSTGPGPFDVQADPAAATLLQGLAAGAAPAQQSRPMSMLSGLANSWFRGRAGSPESQAYFTQQRADQSQQLQDFGILQELAGMIRGNVTQEQDLRMKKHEFGVEEQERSRLNDIVNMGQFGEGWADVNVPGRYVDKLMPHVGRSIAPLSQAEEATADRAERQLGISEGHFGLAQDREGRAQREEDRGAPSRLNEKMLNDMNTQMLLHIKVGNYDEAAQIGEQIQSFLQAQKVSTRAPRSPVPQVSQQALESVKQHIVQTLQGKEWRKVPSEHGGQGSEMEFQVYWLPETDEKGVFTGGLEKKTGNPSAVEWQAMMRYAEERALQTASRQAHGAASINTQAQQSVGGRLGHIGPPGGQ